MGPQFTMPLWGSIIGFPEFDPQHSGAGSWDLATLAAGGGARRERPWPGPGGLQSDLKDPKGSIGMIGHVFTVFIRTENQNQASFSPFGPHEISVLTPALSFNRCAAPAKLLAMTGSQLIFTVLHLPSDPNIQVWDFEWFFLAFY